MGAKLYIKYGDTIQHLWLLRWIFTFSTFSEKDCLSSNQIKSKQNFKKLNGHNVSIELPIWTILSLNLSVQNSSTILPFFSKLQRKFSPISTKLHWDFTFPSLSPSYHMLRWIYRIFFQLWSVIRKLHQILFNKPRRRPDKIPAWREFWNVFSTHLDTKIWDSMLWKLRCLQNYPDWLHVSKLWKIK